MHLKIAKRIAKKRPEFKDLRWLQVLGWPSLVEQQKEIRLFIATRGTLHPGRWTEPKAVSHSLTHKSPSNIIRQNMWHQVMDSKEGQRHPMIIWFSYGFHMVFTCFHYFSVFGSRYLHVTWAPNSRWKIIDITSQCLSTKAAIRLHDPIFHVSLALKWHFLQAVCWYNIWFLIKKRGQNPISPWLLFDGIYKSWWAANESLTTTWSSL